VIGFPPLTIAVFLGMVIVMLIIDFMNHKGNKKVTMCSAIKWSAFYVACAMAFAGYLYYTHGSETMSLFLTGYTLEKVLAFDNLFVFAMIFTYFKIPPSQQHKALYWGIAGAIIFRLIFVVLGVGFMDIFGSQVEIAFALIILWTVWVMHKSGDDDTEDYNNSWYVKGIRKIYPAASPLLLAIVTIEISDVLFSFDSVPAIIAITKDPLLIYSAMIFAILGLRSMFHIIAALMRYFKYMDAAVMLVLVFIAMKLLSSALFDVHMDALLSLAIIVSTLTTSVVLSIAVGEDDEV